MKAPVFFGLLEFAPDLEDSSGVCDRWQEKEG
jgi:hypothetical protein